VIDVEPMIRDELERRVPRVGSEIANWPDILRRSGETQRRRRRRLTSTIIIGGVVFGLALSPLGGAVSRVVGGFSDWLLGTPGTPTSPVVQRQFDTAQFPGNPQLHELLRVTLEGHRFVLYGFATRQVVCLRLAVKALGAGPQTACVSRADLKRSGDLVLPVKANVTVGHIGRLPRSGRDRPTLPKYLLTFGVAAHRVVSVGVRSDRGTSPAVLRNGAFLHVFRPSRRGIWARAIVARNATGRTEATPLSVQVSNQPELRSGLRPHGPSRVDRVVTGGTIGWFIHREARGLSPAQAHVNFRGCCHGYTRLIQPDPDDFLLMLISDHSPIPIPSSTHRRLLIPQPKPDEHRICLGALTHSGIGSGCTTLEELFSEGPLAISWGFSGVGQQLWLVQGLASDDVTRIEVFLGTGQHWRAPLRDNATVFRVPRAKFPVRVVAYDAAGRVVAVQTIR
jgi:hypothetical protein